MTQTSPATDSMYGDHAHLYDPMYAWKDYEAEAEALRAVLVSEGVSEGSRLLEAAVGTGGHLRHLARHFEVAGFDLNAGMIAVARTKLPSCRLWVADMRAFEVEAPVDALICLFSSIGYLTDQAQLEQAAARFHAALRPGGLLVIEPWLTPEQWRDGHPSLQTYDSPDLKLARGTVGRREGELSVLDMHWLVVRPGQPVEHFVDQHRVWLCPRDQMRQIFEAAGFDLRFEDPGLPRGRGLFIGKRR